MNEFEKTLYEKFAGQIMTDYIWWVLQNAERDQVKTLYFLARDGWLLREIAKTICDCYNLKIECKYLYCSRLSLRTPTYWMIGEEAFDLLSCGGYQLRLDSLLQRAGLNKEERQNVYNSCGWTVENEQRLLTWAEFGEISQTLRKNEVYRQYVIEKSKAAYPSAIGYLRQEGLFDERTIAIVDSGWTGSMQRSLRQLLESAGWKGNLVGYYFGMYKKPDDPADGIYNTWYFSGEKNCRQKAIFNNNLFECLLSAPHGMTGSYRKEADRFVPLLMQGPDESRIAQIYAYRDCVLNYTAEKCRQHDFHRKISRKETDRTIRRYMLHPTEEEVYILGRYVFCDDITEAYENPLADASLLDQLKNYTVLGRLKVRFLSKRDETADAGLYWPYGTAAFLKEPKRAWYRANILLWQYTKYRLNHI